LFGDLALALSACGGGSSPTCTSDIATLCDKLGVPSVAPSTATGGTTTSALGTLQLSLTDASGVAQATVSPTQAGTLRALLRDSNGAAAPDVAVTFTTTDSTGAFVPSSATALSDQSGVAQVGLPAGTQTGAFTVTANATVGGKVAASSVSYAVAFPTLALSALSVTPQPLSSGGNASISLTVLNGTAAYAPPLAVAFSSPCATAGKAVIGSPELTQNGVATASYTDKGCGVADTVTASVALGGTSVSKTGVVTVLPAKAGSIKFVSANTTNIALKGTGGFGRQEFSTLTFQVFDTTGNPVAGKLVDFVFADCVPTTINDCSAPLGVVGVGGLTLNPTSATSAADGTVTTLVAAGTIPTSVRVVTWIDGVKPMVTTLSNVLVISTGVPDQQHFSLATETGNCEGRDFDQKSSTVTVTLGDHFSNPVANGTVVNFTTESGVIDASCVINDSATCGVLLWASGQRPANGRVTVLAYVLGEESFFDYNGNNVCDNCDDMLGLEFNAKYGYDIKPDIFRNDDESGVRVQNPDGTWKMVGTWTPGEPCIGPNTNGTCNTPGDGKYNGVLRNPQVETAQTVYVSGPLVQMFSGSHANFTFNPPALICPVDGTVDVLVTVKDDNGNLMPAKTIIDLEVVFGAYVGAVIPNKYTVPNVVLAVGEPLLVPSYKGTVKCFGGNGIFSASATTPNFVKTTDSIPITESAP
jgi:hypothetical protein